MPAHDVPAYAQTWREGRLLVEALVSSRIALGDVDEGVDDLTSSRAIRQVIDITTSS